MKVNSKEEALQIAFASAPELHNKIIYKVSDKISDPSSDIKISDGKECWYISYSSYDKHCAFPAVKPKLLVISKDTGEIVFRS